jgi:hypothetical protein
LGPTEGVAGVGIGVGIAQLRREFSLYGEGRHEVVATMAKPRVDLAAVLLAGGSTMSRMATYYVRVFTRSRTMAVARVDPDVRTAVTRGKELVQAAR